jgi:beta-lactamase class A
MFLRGSLVFVVVLTSIACSRLKDVPTEFPTPPPAPVATPVTKIELHPDAELEKQFAQIAEGAKGKVGAMAVVLETGESASLNADQHFPMQSVYKLPICIAVMDQVRLGKLDLDEQIGVTKEDMVREGQRSPLRDKTPDGGVFTIYELIRLSLLESDGTASDVLIRTAGGPGEIQAYLTHIGIRDVKVMNTEKELDWQTQYDNWATPAGSIELLQHLCATASGSSSGLECPAVMPVDDLSMFHDQLKSVLYLMSVSVPGAKRLKGELPKGVIVAHKTGTGGSQNGIAAATNDIGIVYLPNGGHLAIAVYISDSAADERTREAVIAKIAKAAWGRWSK